MQTSLTGWLQRPKVSPPTYASVLQDEQLSTASSNVLAIAPAKAVGERTSHSQESETRTSKANAKPPLSLYGPGHHPNITFIRATADRINEYKRVNSLLLQIPYGRTFYDEILNDGITNSITLLAVWSDDPVAATLHELKGHKTAKPTRGKVIGGIRCRLLAPYEVGVSLASPRAFSSSAGMERILYISALGVLSPYRNLGIAGQLLSRLTAFAAQTYGIDRVGAHVWEANIEGRDWYARRGFREVKRLEDYYRKLDPSSAFVLLRDIEAEAELVMQAP